MLPPAAELDSELALLHATYQEWLAAWISPANQAVFNHHFAEARALLDRARRELAEADLPEDVRAALAYPLAFADCRVNWHPDNGGHTQAEYDELLAWLSVPAAGRLAECIRRMNLVSTRCVASYENHDQPSRAEIEALLALLPEELAAPGWHEAARWAFRRGELEMLERAFELFLLYPSRNMSQARWQRVNLMYQLLSGKAVRRDVEEYVVLLKLRPQLREFLDELWPRCQALGLVDAELEQLLAERRAAIQAGDDVLTPAPRTKSFLGR